MKEDGDFFWSWQDWCGTCARALWLPDQSRRAAACGRAQLPANFFGDAVWGNFCENANCGDPG